MRFLPLLTLALFGAACTGQIPTSFRLAQQEQSYPTSQKVNTKIDLLWVVDNSASMDVSQQKLRDGFAGFARKYLKPTWDIRVAVITTDTYMADPAFSSYLERIIPGTTGWKSPQILSRLSTFANPASNPELVNLSTGAFDHGVAYGDLVPVWGPAFARLLPGLHDGPIAGFCFEGLPYFMKGASRCAIRDDQTRSTGPSKCLSPGAGESSLTECVNTVENDTIHSGRPIVSTMPPEGTPGNAAWTDQLIRDFTVNVTTGSVGQGSERGLSSILQLLKDNEPSETAFFRAGSLRGVIFVSDEEDQSMAVPESLPSGFNPWTYYRCDQTSLKAMNPSGNITGTNGYCCSDPSKNCFYGKDGTSCPSKQVDGESFTPSVCANPDRLMAVSDIKTKLDGFFGALDGMVGGTGNYFVVSIVPTTLDSIRTLQGLRDRDDVAVGGFKTISVDRGDRYIELGQLVGSGSFAMDIGASDYSPILDALGKEIISKKSTFQLARVPTGTEDMIVTVGHADGSSEQIPPEKFKIQGKTLVIDDLDFVLTLASTDVITINYQPKTVF